MTLERIPLRPPEKWSPAWFERWVYETLAPLINAAAGGGGGESVQSLLDAGLITQGLESLPMALPLVGQPGVVTAAQVGTNYQIGLEPGGIGYGYLRSIDALALLGNPAGPAGAPSPIVSSVNDTVARRVGDAIDFGTLTVDMAPDGLWTYGKLQDVSTDARVLGIASGAPGPMTELTLSQVLDFIGSAAEGDILYRGASGWERLPRGTDGQVLTLASGAPAWADPDSLLQGSYVTADDETGTVANSRQLVGGDGITLDSSTPGVLSVENDNP